MFQKQSNASLLRSLLGKLKLKNSSNVSRIHKGNHQLHSVSVNSACFVLGSLTNSQTVTSSSFRDPKKKKMLLCPKYIASTKLWTVQTKMLHVLLQISYNSCEKLQFFTPVVLLTVAVHRYRHFGYHMFHFVLSSTYPRFVLASCLALLFFCCKLNL